MVNLENLYGHEIYGLNLTGAHAVAVIRKKGHGIIRSAFYKPGIGDIDLIWGNKDLGISHIIASRQRTRQSVDGVLSNLGETIEKGVIIERGNPREAYNFYVEYGKKDKRYLAVITKYLHIGGSITPIRLVLSVMEIFPRNLRIKQNRMLAAA